jgi:hypothetical protein
MRRAKNRLRTLLPGSNRRHDHVFKRLVVVAVIVRAGVVLEVGVVAGLLGRDAAGRVVGKHHLKEVETGLVEVRDQGNRVVTNPLGEGRLEVGIARNAGPDLLSRGAEQAGRVSKMVFEKTECGKRTGRS